MGSRHFLLLGLVVGLIFLGYGYQRIQRGAQAFEDDIRPRLNYPIELDDDTTITYATVSGYNVLFNLEIRKPYDRKDAWRFHESLFGSFKDTRYCHPTLMLAFHEVEVITRVHYPFEDRDILIKDKLTYLCGIHLITGKRP